MARANILLALKGNLRKQIVNKGGTTKSLVPSIQILCSSDGRFLYRDLERWFKYGKETYKWWKNFTGVLI